MTHKLIYSEALCEFLQREQLPYETEFTPKKVMRPTWIILTEFTSQDLFSLGMGFEKFLVEYRKFSKK